MPDVLAQARGELETLGLIARDADGWRTTRRWQGAMARAALRLLEQGRTDGPLTLPVVMALVDLVGGSRPDAELVSLVEALLPIERGDTESRRDASADASGEHGGLLGG